MKHSELLEVVTYILNQNTRGDGLRYDVQTVYKNEVHYTIVRLDDDAMYSDCVALDGMGNLDWKWKEKFLTARIRFVDGRA